MRDAEHEPRGLARRWALWQLLGVAAAAIASMATSMADPHPYPLWRIDTRQPAPTPGYRRWRRTPFPYVARRAGHGVRAEIWIVRSGKSGLGVALRLRNEAAHARRITLVGLRLRLENAGEVAHPALTPLELAAGAEQTLYAGLPFDNERFWNEGWRQGELEVHLAIASDDTPEPHSELWRIPLVHDWKAMRWVSRRPTFEPPKRHRRARRAQPAQPRHGAAEAAP